MSIRVQAIEGVWETLGVDRWAGIIPEGINPTYNDWGPDGLTFSLKRDPTIDHPDLNEFTPIELVVGGRVIWDGYVIETPGAGGDAPSVNVSALGWQYELDADVVPITYAHDDLKAWQDVRGFSPFIGNLAFPQAGIVRDDDGALYLGWPIGTSWPTSAAAGVLLDLGPDVGRGFSPGTGAAPAPGLPNLPGPRRIIVTLHRTAGNPANVVLYAYAHRKPVYWTIGGDVDAVWGANFNAQDVSSAIFQAPQNTLSADPAAPSTLRGTFALDGLRFVTLWLSNSGAAYTPGLEDAVKIQRIRVFTSSAYESGDVSILKASDVWADAVTRATALSPATDRIAVTSVAIPHLAYPGEDVTPRKLIETANAFHGYRARLIPGRQLEVTPQANRPLLSVNPSAPGARFVDASANSGRDVYNHVIAKGTSGGGRPLRVHRWTDPGEAGKARVTQPPNPSADVDVSSWTVVAGTITRDTGFTHSSPGSFRLGTSAGFTSEHRSDWASGMVAGRRYRLRVAGRVIGHASGTPNGRRAIAVELYASTGAANPLVSLLWDGHPDLDTPDAWLVKDAVFVAPAGITGSQRLRLFGRNAVTGTGALGYLDSIELAELTGTQLDRRSRQRTKVIEVTIPVDEVALGAIADVALAAAARPQLRGTLDVTLDDAVTLTANGRPVPIVELPLYIGELITLGGLVDPATGATGRPGIIRAVSITDAGATLTIDNDRASFDALVGRMAAVSG